MHFIFIPSLSSCVLQKLFKTIKAGISYMMVQGPVNLFNAYDTAKAVKTLGFLN